MKRLLVACAFLLASVGFASAQNVNLNCYTGPNYPQWTPCQSSNPLYVTGASGGLAANITGWASGVLGAMANYGTSPGAVLVPGMNAFVTNTVAVTATPSATVGLTPSTTAALAASEVVKNAAGNLYSFNVSADSTLSGAAWWIMIFNATSLPGDGSVTPTKCYALPSGTTSYSAAFNVPVYFSTGITIGVSTTGCFTKTASTHAFISGDAQ